MHDYLNDNYYEANQNDEMGYNSHNKSDKKYRFIIVILIVLIIVGCVILFLRKDNDFHYSSYEEKLINAAEKYITSNNVVSYKEIYLDATTLGVDLPSSCSLKSGVIYNNTYEAYLLCDNYESEALKENNDNIKLIGNKLELVSLGSEYYDPGYIGNNVKVIGSVGKEEGVYTLFYLLEDGTSVKRKVVVTGSSVLNKYFPYLTLIGDSVKKIKIGSTFQDEGVVATDLVDGVITNNVIKYGNVDTNTVGEYKIFYSITNSKGYTTTISRKVIVEDNKKDLYVVHELSTTEKTSGEVEIILNILGDDYAYTVLPNGFANEERILSYNVAENGVYTFDIYDSNDKVYNYPIEVSNIKEEKPTGSCIATLYNDKTVIEVKGVSSNGILGYNYFLNDTSTGYRLNNTYSSSVIKPTKVYVKLLDNNKNEGNVYCSIENKMITVDLNGITRLVSGSRLSIPVGEALARKGYTINDLNACIYNRVKKAGPGTRYGVMEAGAGLIECTKAMTGYVYAYDHDGGKVEGNYCVYNSDICGKLGVNSRWGRKGGTCKRSECYYGLNCANFVHWAFCNGGMDMCTKGSAGATSLATTNYFPDATIIQIFRNKAKYIAGEDLTQRYSASQIVSMIKPGDALHREMYNDPNGGTVHIVLVVGKDDKYLYVAENGDKIIKYSIASIISSDYVYKVLLLDNYYANTNNLNNLYN